MDPDDVSAYITLGARYEKQGNLTKVIEMFEKVIELEPDFANVYINLGSAYYDQGKPELRISNYKKAARLGHQGAQGWLKKNGHDW